MNVERLPNFVLAGPPKTGSTSLHGYLRQHPEVYMSGNKEPTFFGAADLWSEPFHEYTTRRIANGAPLVREWSAYVDLFQDGRERTAIGEASVDYFWLPGAAQAMQAKLPEVRLIFVLRDPAERLFSEYLPTLWRAIPGTPVSFRAQFLAAVDRLDPSAAVRPHVGRYATHLQRFFALFPRNQIRIYLHEDYRADPTGMLRDIFAFLGVDPGCPIDLSVSHNVPILPRLPRLHALRRRIFGKTPLTTWLPDRVRRPLSRWYHQRRSEVRMRPSDRAMVIEYYREEVKGTAELLERDLSAWLR